MELFLSIFFIMLAVAIGAFAAKLPFFPKGKILDIFVRLFLYLLLAFMGIRLAFDKNALAGIGRIGVMAFSFAFMATAFSVLLAVIVLALGQSKAGKSRQGGPKPEDAPETISQVRLLLSRLKDPGKLLLAAIIGFCIGMTMPFVFDTGEAVTWTLYGLLFCIGAQMSIQGIPLKDALKNPMALALPLATIAGSLIAGLSLAPIFGLAWNRGCALASGFGWYSLSGVLIADLGDPALGSAAFLSNLFRETLAILIIPMIGGTRFSAAAISAAGATSMDVTLPLMERYAGPDTMPVSFFHGVLISLLVPVLVPFFMGLG